MIQRLEAVARAIEKGRAGEEHADVLYDVRNALADAVSRFGAVDEFTDDQGRRWKLAQ